METAQEALADIQSKLKAPKDKKNTFGNYNYRTAEGMLAAAKGFTPQGATIVLSDKPCDVSGKLVLIATATFSFKGESIEATSFALHALQKKGMDEAQISGAASSYARKYALGGLLAIDDSEGDPDGKPPINPIDEAVHALKGCQTLDSLASVWTANKGFQSDSRVLKAKEDRKAELTKETEGA